MKLARLRPADVVVCEFRGARFEASVLERREGRLRVRLIKRGQLPRGLFVNDVAELTARQVVRRVERGRAAA